MGKMKKNRKDERKTAKVYTDESVHLKSFPESPEHFFHVYLISQGGIPRLPQLQVIMGRWAF